MRILIVKAPNELALITDASMPQMGDYDALVRNVCCAICNGTDMEIIAGRLEEAKRYPLMLGHESAGRVVACGSRVRHYREGDLVTRSVVRANERYFSSWGAFSEYGVVTDYAAMVEDGRPDAGAYTIGLMQRVFPAGISAEAAAVTITMKEVYAAFERMGIRPGDRVLTVGDGPVSMCMLEISKLFGVGAFHVLGQNPRTLARLRANGASGVFNRLEPGDMEALSALERSFDQYIDTIGREETIRQGMRFLRPDGQIVVYGLHTEEVISLPVRQMRNWCLRFMQFPIHAKEGATHRRICEAVLRGELKPEVLITHRFPLEAYAEGFGAIRRGEAVKVILTL